MSNGNACYVPCLDSLLLPLLAIVRAANGLMRPEVVRTFHGGLANVHSIPAHQKRTVLGAKAQSVEEQSSSGVKVIISPVIDSCSAVVL